MLFIVYLITAPSNRVESLDGFDYIQAAQTIPFFETHDTRSILFHKSNRALFVLLQAFGLEEYLESTLRCLIVLAAAGVLLLMDRLLVRGFALSKEAALIGSLTLCFSYGFWRYASEVEVYIPSIFLILASLNLLLDALDKPGARWWEILPAAALAGISASYYQPNVVPLFLAAVILLFSRERFLQLIIYGATATTIVLFVTISFYLLQEYESLSVASLFQFINRRSGEFPEARSPLRSGFLAFWAILNDVISTKWIYGVNPILDILREALPRQLARNEPEIYAATHFRPFLYLPVLILPVLAAIVILIVFRAVRSPYRTPHNRLLLLTAVWFLTYALIAGRLDPSTSEVWIVALAPLTILFAIYVLQPALINGGLGPSVAALCLLACHNFFGGIGIFMNSSGDMYRAQTKWLASNVRPGDAMIDNNWDDRRWAYLRHRIGLGIIRVDEKLPRMEFIDPRKDKRGPIEALIQDVHARGGRLFITENFFRPGESVHLLRGKEAYAHAIKLAALLRARSQLVSGDGAERIYEIRP